MYIIFYIILAHALSRVCFEESFKFAHKRKTFGKFLVEHPVIRNKLGKYIVFLI